MSYPYAAETNSAAAAAGVPAALLAAIPWRESGHNQMAVGDNGCSCSQWQLNTCGGAGSGYTCQQLQSDVSLSAHLAARYLRACLDAFPGDLYRGIAAYRQGVGGVYQNGPVNLNNYINDIIAKYEEYSGSSGGGNDSNDFPIIDNPTIVVQQIVPYLVLGGMLGIVVAMT